MENLEKKKPPLFDYAYLKSFDDILKNLSEMAMKEEWDYSITKTTRKYPILSNYLHHTFSRTLEQGKIKKSGVYSCFNTGLVTENQEEIFMLFKERSDQKDKLFFVQFCKESDTNMVKFHPLPERASYFTNTSELFYEPGMELRINIDHIIEDRENFNRFPDHIKALQKHQLMMTFSGAIEHAKKRVRRNYKTAIPQYYRGKYVKEGQLQLLLPLCLTNPAKADLALAIYKNDNAYMGRTCLTLDMAINNARLIAKPDDEWLKP